MDKVIAQLTKNKKGQALVEFVLILPILLLFLFVIIDFANIYYSKNHLEGVVSDVVTFVENGKTTDEIYSSLDDEEILRTMSLRSLEWDNFSRNVNDTLEPELRSISFEDFMMMSDIERRKLSFEAAN